jgi:HPt (histidine-containing phosphotransfer) domain-containing protein
MQSEPAPHSLCQVDAQVVAELRRVSGSAKLYSRLVDLFRTGSSDALAQLRSALSGPGFQPARAVCHKLKSSAANVGALAFSRQVALLEQRCAEEDLTRARELLEGLQAAHSGLMTELARLTHAADEAARWVAGPPLTRT